MWYHGNSPRHFYLPGTHVRGNPGGHSLVPPTWRKSNSVGGSLKLLCSGCLCLQLSVPLAVCRALPGGFNSQALLRSCDCVSFSTVSVFWALLVLRGKERCSDLNCTTIQMAMQIEELEGKCLCAQTMLNEIQLLNATYRQQRSNVY